MSGTRPRIQLKLNTLALFDLSRDRSEQNNIANQHPDIVADLEARLLTYAKEKKPSEWIKAQPAFLGAQGKSGLSRSPLRCLLLASKVTFRH